MAATYSISDTAVAIKAALATGNGGLTAVQNAVTVDESSGAGTLTLTNAEFDNLLIGTSLLAASDTIELNNWSGALTNYGGNGTLTLGIANGNAFVDMLTSGVTEIHLDGTGNHIINAGTVGEIFILGSAQNGGSQISTLLGGDQINIDGAAGIKALTVGAGVTNLGGTGAVDFAGEWSFAGSTLTYWSELNAEVGGAGAALTLTLTGTITTLTMQAGGDTFVVG